MKTYFDEVKSYNATSRFHKDIGPLCCILNIKENIFSQKKPPLLSNWINKLAVDIAAPEIEMYRVLNKRILAVSYEWGHWGGLGLIGNYSPLLKLRFPIILKIQVLSFFGIRRLLRSEFCQRISLRTTKPSVFSGQNSWIRHLWLVFNKLADRQNKT